MKQVFLLIFLLSFVHKSNGQTSTKRKEANIQLFKSEMYDIKLKRYLTLKNTMFNLMLYPTIEKQTIDTLLAIYNNQVDSTDIVSSLNSDSTCIYLKQSYHWNIKQDLPHQHGLSNLKFLFKDNTKYTEQDRELMNYLKFYSNPNDSLVERYVIYRSITLNADTLIQVIHEIKPKPYQIKLLT